MKILLINYEYPPLGGGAANASQALALEWTALGHEVLVLTSRFRGQPAEEQAEEGLLLRVPVWRRHQEKCTPAEMATFIWSASQALGRVIPRVRPDIAVAFFGIPGGPVARKAKRRFGLPYLISLRGGDVPGTERRRLAGWHALTRPWIRRIWRDSAAVVANSEGLADLAGETLPGRKIHVIPNGVDCARFHPREAGAGRAADGIVRMLSVGRLDPKKRIGGIFAALAGLRDVPAWRLRIVGDGPERSALGREAARLGIAERVEFSGWLQREALPAVYRESDLFVFNSDSEGMPNVVLEAMASGVPVVSSRAWGVEEIVEHEKSGLLVPVADQNALGNALDRALRDAEWRGRASRAAIERARQFGWRRSAQDYAALMEKARATNVKSMGVSPR